MRASCVEKTMQGWSVLRTRPNRRWIRSSGVTHVSLVRPPWGRGIPGQDQTNTDIQANQGQVMIISDDNEDPPVVEWEFEKILDYACRYIR
jgi:hypothetical protein